jgi:hypothetical protein
MSSDKLVGFWEGEGSETRLYNNNTSELVKLIIVKEIIKLDQMNVYKVTDTFYYENSSDIFYGPVDYLLDTKGKNEFVCADEYRFCSGIDSYHLDETSTTMKYSYNCNGIYDQSGWKSLNGDYTLFKKDSKPLYQSVSTTKGTLKLKDGSVIIETATASATGFDASVVEEDSKKVSVDTVIKLLNSLSGGYQGDVITDTHTDSVVTLLH